MGRPNTVARVCNTGLSPHESVHRSPRNVPTKKLWVRNEIDLLGFFKKLNCSKKKGDWDRSIQCWFSRVIIGDQVLFLEKGLPHTPFPLNKSYRSFHNLNRRQKNSKFKKTKWPPARTDNLFVSFDFKQDPIFFLCYHEFFKYKCVFYIKIERAQRYEWLHSTAYRCHNQIRPPCRKILENT
jgi:hypothetical protein